MCLHIEQPKIRNKNASPRKRTLGVTMLSQCIRSLQATHIFCLYILQEQMWHVSSLRVNFCASSTVQLTAILSYLLSTGCSTACLVKGAHIALTLQSPEHTWEGQLGAVPIVSPGIPVAPCHFLLFSLLCRKTQTCFWCGGTCLTSILKGRWWHGLPVGKKEKGVTDKCTFLFPLHSMLTQSQEDRRSPANVCRAHLERSVTFFLGFLNDSVGGISNELGNLSHTVFKNTILNKK